MGRRCQHYDPAGMFLQTYKFEIAAENEMAHHGCLKSTWALNLSSSSCVR